MSFVRLLSFLAIVLALVLSAEGQRAYDPVHLLAEDGAEGNGVRFRVSSGCIVITADHVLRNSPIAEITPSATGSNRLTLSSRDGDLDIALLPQASPQNSECPVLPKAEMVNSTILKDQHATIVYISRDGSQQNLPSYVTSHNPVELELALSNFTTDPNPPRFIKGMSGAIVVINGVPVATLQKISLDGSGTATATRLDETMRRFSKDLPTPPPVTKVAEIEKHKPYDLKVLPRKYQKIVREARKTKQRAITMCEQAERAKQLSEDAASRARALPLNLTSDGHSRFRADNGNFYEGQVKRVGTMASSHGFGIAIKGEGDHIGNETYCEFERNKGCQGPGVYIFKSNEGNTNNLDRWCGNFKNGNRYGLGYLTWNDDLQSEAWYVMGQGSKPGVWNQRGDTKRLYEGYITSTWHGEGVVWDENGQVYQLGEWENGKTKRNDTNAWRAGTLK